MWRYWQLLGPCRITCKLYYQPAATHIRTWRCPSSTPALFENGQHASRFIVSYWYVLPVQPQISSFCICHPPYSCQFTFKSNNALHGAHMRPSTNNERQRPRTPSILHFNPSFQRHHDDLHQSVHYRVLMATAVSHTLSKGHGGVERHHFGWGVRQPWPPGCPVSRVGARCSAAAV